MRRATFAEYNGRGWDSPTVFARQAFAANQSWLGETGQGRAELRQWVRTADPTDLLFAAGEPLAPALDYEISARGDGDLVALWATGESVTRYEMRSAVPAVDDETLQSWPGFLAEDPALANFAPHLRLPDTITERTRALAGELTADLTTPYAKATALEAYLRGYAYDLEIDTPPDEVDVVDYFLFDLQRGYCDYYATAFVVLARLNGLPTRFATGYVPGGWNPEAGEWVITEAEAHSWPEVYFPALGWIPFEPTAGRAPLERVRVDLATPGESTFTPPPMPASEVARPAAANWQMLVWLLPLLALGFMLWIWIDQRRHRDPWLALIRWGRRLGRPLRTAETELEYGVELSHHLGGTTGEAEKLRRLRRAVADLTQAVSEARYGPHPSRSAAWVRASERWQSIRAEVGRFGRLY